MITEKSRQGFNDKLKYTKLKYPQCNCGSDCPLFFFNYLGIGTRASGKTYNCVKLLKHYETHKNKITDPDGNQYDLRYFLISPTSSANPIYTSLDSLDEDDIFDSYSDATLQSIIDSIDARREETEKYLKYKKAYKMFLKLGEANISKIKNEDLMLLSRYNFEEPESIFDIRNKNPVISVIILDDLLGSDAFSKKNASLLKYFLIRNRHKRVCFMLLSQSMKSIPKDIRLNCNLFFYGQFRNEKMIKDDLYEEVSKEFSPEEFMELFKHINKEQYGSLIIDATKDKLKISNGWDRVLYFNEKLSK
jgi:hypothetical protein